MDVSIVKELKPLDCICTGNNSLFARAIRFASAGRVGLSGVKESLRLRLASHSGLIVKLGDVTLIAEMLGTGLEFNPISDYLTDKNKIIAIRRLRLGQNDVIAGNKFLLSLYQSSQLKYSTGELFNFFGAKINNPSRMYCSEMCEIIANQYNRTWSNWQLSKRKIPTGIAPCEIQFGCGLKVWDRHDLVK